MEKKQNPENVNGKKLIKRISLGPNYFFLFPLIYLVMKRASKRLREDACKTLHVVV